MLLSFKVHMLKGLEKGGDMRVFMNLLLLVTVTKINLLSWSKGLTDGLRYLCYKLVAISLLDLTQNELAQMTETEV